MQHLYISYPPDDNELAHRLVDDLQAAGYAVFVDAVSALGSMAWAAETRRAIQTCGAMVMILSLADRRRIGIRHEGVLARRRGKPVYVLTRSPGDLPRYLSGATVLDFSSSYDAALKRLLDALPAAGSLLSDPALSLRRRRRLARRSRHHTRRRRIMWGAGLLAMLALCLLLGLLFGLIPV
ncbi:MAG: toll/interleukin-1 receptor domain-containing protein [Anaerolineae bacterium]|nr:toll/interleukin-1 receptor domain-containing protein [Anaerolineae bacterium]